MVAVNTNSLRQVHGYDFLSNIKWCEFHFCYSVQKHSKKLDGHNQTVVINLAIGLLSSAAPENYNEYLRRIFCDFTNDKESLKPWLVWWNKRKHLTFRDFTASNAPQSNLAEMIHAGWKDQDDVGLDIFESTKSDVRDSASDTESGFGKDPSLNQTNDKWKSKKRLNQQNVRNTV